MYTRIVNIIQGFIGSDFIPESKEKSAIATCENMTKSFIVSFGMSF